jgi:hypothetical protein
MVYRHASAIWDEPNPKEREKEMGFQTGITSHTKVTRLEGNALLGRGMDLNSLTCTLSNVHNSSTNSINLQFWRCDYMAPRPSTFAYLQHSTFHS